MAQLNQFNGGLNTRLAPHIIGVNEAIVYKNIDNSSISLRPIKSTTDEETLISKYFINFKDTWVSSSAYRTYQEFKEKLYYSDGVGKPQKSSDGISWSNLGIDGPTVKATTLLIEAPVLDTVSDPIPNTISNITSATLSSTTGGNLTDNTTYNYKFVNIVSGITSVVYSITGTVNSTDNAIFISNIVGVDGTVYIYRDYLGTYRLVGTTTGASLNDTVLDISANDALVEVTEFPLGELLEYVYDAYDSSSGLRAPQQFNSITLSSTEKTYSITISAVASVGTVTYYRKYTDDYRLISSTDDTYILTTSIKPDEEKYLSGTYQHCYTFYNDTDGTESQPSEYSDELEIVNGSITLSGQGSGDPQVNRVRVYRIGGSLTSMTEVVEVGNPGAVTGSYTDKMPDLEVDGHILDSFNNAPAPTGLNYLTEHNAMFFGCTDDKLYYSDIAYVNYWSAFNFIDFDHAITGIGATANGLLVFTKYKTYIVTGTSPLTLSKYLISSNQGCLDHRSISFAKNTLLWASTDGICASSGGDVIVASRDKLGKTDLTDIRDSKVYDDVYYLAYGDKLLALDTRFGNILREVTQEVDSLSIYNDVLYYTLSGKLYSLFTGSGYMAMDYKSPKLSDGQLSNLKNYKTIYTRCLGDLEVRVYIDDMLIVTKSINTKTTEILIPQQNRQGYYIQFEVTGTGELLELQYIVEGRQNGR